MGFLDNLKKQDAMLSTPIAPNPQFMLGGSGGDGGIGSMLSSITPFINNMRNRNLDDLRSQLQITNQYEGPNIRDPRMRNMMDPNGAQNVILNSGMTDFQKASLSLDRDKLNSGNSIDKEKLALAKSTGEDKLALQKGALELNELKNDQIYQTKIKDMERKAEEANAKLELAQQQLQGRENNTTATMAYRQAQLEAVNARHELDLAQRDAALEESKRLHDAQIADMKARLDAAGNTTQTTEVNDEGTKKTVTTKKGSSDNTARVSVIGPNNQKGTVTAEESKSLPKGWSVRK